jgi:hypothetical protein
VSFRYPQIEPSGHGLLEARERPERRAVLGY